MVIPSPRIKRYKASKATIHADGSEFDGPTCRKKHIYTESGNDNDQGETRREKLIGVPMIAHIRRKKTPMEGTKHGPGEEAAITKQELDSIRNGPSLNDWVYLGRTSPMKNLVQHRSIGHAQHQAQPEGTEHVLQNKEIGRANLNHTGAAR